MARFCPLFSGSSGNSTYISTSAGGILIDAGVSCKMLCQAIESAGGDISGLKAVAVTHEHIDHVQGLKVLVKKTGIPVIASTETLNALIRDGRLPEGAKTVCADSGTVELEGITLDRFATSHDCAGSSGYTVTLPDGKRVAVCTDLGYVSAEVRSALTGCATVLIESNHDIEMLKRGPYPPALKLRILSEAGHLSNLACSAELPALLKNGTTRFILGHLSQHNNLPMLAVSAARASLADIGATDGTDYILKAAKPSGNEVIAL